MYAGFQQIVPGSNEEEQESYFNAAQNAFIVKDAEEYYRTLGYVSSWNQRDTHMANTLDRLIQYLGPSAKAILWEHNTHVGDARATDMATYGEVNVGQLVRERHAAEGVVAVGASSYQGSVIAADEWGQPMEQKPVPAGIADSWESLLHEAGPENKLLILTDEQGTQTVSPEFNTKRGHRAIGVQYNPENEAGNYVPTDLPRRYDALLFIDQTQALHPIHMEPMEPPASATDALTRDQ
jgi:erythromycin esterase